MGLFNRKTKEITVLLALQEGLSDKDKLLYKTIFECIANYSKDNAKVTKCLLTCSRRIISEIDIVDPVHFSYTLYSMLINPKFEEKMDLWTNNPPNNINDVHIDYEAYYMARLSREFIEFYTRPTRGRVYATMKSI